MKKRLKEKTTTEALQWWEDTKKNVTTEARWLALYDAINIAADKAEQKGIDFDSLKINHKAINDYLDSQQDIIALKLMKDRYNVEIVYDEEFDETLIVN